MSEENLKEKVEFKAEVAQVLNLVIHSLYSHPEIFLRELVSNASDAIDKHRHLTLCDERYKRPEAPYEIHIIPDKKKKTLTIRDNGIGMTREEVIQNLGTIASSGTKAFLEQLQDAKQAAVDLIGQFGVGFYSAFMVASSVRVETRRAGCPEASAVRWESDGSGGYTVEAIEKTEHGTDVILSMKESGADYLTDFGIRDIVRKYSDYVAYPILLTNEKGERDTINKVTAIWRRAKGEVKEEEYFEFYKYISHDSENPLLYCHHAVEGALEYRMLLYIPQKAPVNFYREDIRGLRLHVKKMFVTDEYKELLPVYLRFVRGVVDSEDLPLNISRETLQRSPVLGKIQKQLTKRVFDMLEDLAERDPGSYRIFFRELGVALKEGLAMDFENRTRILELLRYASSAGQTREEMISLKEYVMRMKPEQKVIYYLSGPSWEACIKSPHLEIFRKKGIEVLLMTDIADEWSTPVIGEYEGKKMQSITKSGLDLSDVASDAEEKKEASDAEFKEVKDRLWSALQGEIKEVRLSARLQESPCCLVADEADMDMHMEKIMRALGKEFKPAKRILEINPSHPIIRNMRTILARDPKDEKIKQWGKILYDQALLSERTSLEEPSEFIRNVNELLAEVSERKASSD